MNSKNQQKKKEIDWMITLVPLALIVALCIVFFFAPEQSNQVLGQIRFLFGDTFGTYYLVIGLGIFFLSLFLAGSKYGNIVLGKPDEKPKYSFFAWGCMMFTCGLAADILFYSFSEWILYATDPHIAELGSIQDWAGVFPLFHWSFIPWGFYLVLAVAFGFMLHVRKRNRQKYSEACRPILGKQTDGIGGRLIDLLAVFALLAGTATTFSVATPLMAEIIGELFHMEVSRTVINIIILLITCCVYTYSLLHGFKGISILAKVCIYLFFGLLAFVLLFGGETRYIIETGFSSLGKMIQNFIGLSTYTDPMRTTNFPQNWTIYYWAYWMVWCVAAPFFIGSISRGRTVRQTILGGYGFGVSFIILGNYSMGKQISGAIDFISQYNENGDLYHLIVSMIKTMPCAPLIMVVVLVTMVAFYATSFDSIALTASCYSYRKLEDGEEPAKGIQLMWCILLILLPIALLFAESSMNSLQSVSIVAAFPIGIVIVMIAVSFLKDAKRMERRKKRIVKLTAFLFLLAASIFVMPQKAFADENEDITLPTGDIKPMEPQQDESGIDTYGADEGDEFSGTEYELYTVLENRVKEAMLAGNEWVSIKDLKIRRDTYDLSFYYGYSPYFSSDTYNRIIAWYGDAYYTGLRITNTFGTPEETKQIFNAVDEKLASIYKLVNNSMTDEFTIIWYRMQSMI